MRVLQVHNRYRRPGGEDTVVEAEADLLRGGGHEVHLLEGQNPHSWLPAARKLARAPWNSSAVRAVHEAAVRLRPDVAHVHNTWFTFTPAVVEALSECGVPVVMTLHNYRLICANSYLFRDGGPCEQCVASHPWHGVVHRCYNHSALASVPASATIAYNRRRGTWNRNVSLFFALTRFSRDRFVAGGLPADQIRVKPHFFPDPGPRAQPPSASPTILYAGRLAPEKGLDVLIRALNRTEDLELLVLGTGDDEARLRRLAGPGVRFLGQRSPADVRHYMAQSRALAFPSLSYETFGLVLVEAMAAGLPTVASELGGTPDIVGPDSGLLVPPGSVEAWASALRRLDDDTVDAAGQAARTRWRHQFSPWVALPELERGYEWAIEQHRRPA